MNHVSGGKLRPRRPMPGLGEVFGTGHQEAPELYVLPNLTIIAGPNSVFSGGASEGGNTPPKFGAFGAYFASKLGFPL